MQCAHSPDPYLLAYSAAGVKLDSNRNGLVLAPATTYYVPFGGENAPYNDVQLQWDAVAILTSVEVEFSNNPDASPFSAVLGEWIKSNLVGPFGSLDATSGTVTALTLGTAGGTVGGAMWHLVNASLRGRLKIVVGAAGGTVKPTCNGKA